MAADPRSNASPLNERFSLDSVINGLAGDLSALRAGQISVEDARVRAGQISVEDARVRAELANQILNGVRTVVNAQKFLEGRALPLPSAGSDHG